MDWVNIPNRLDETFQSAIVWDKNQLEKKDSSLQGFYINCYDKFSNMLCDLLMNPWDSFLAQKTKSVKTSIDSEVEKIMEKSLVLAKKDEKLKMQGDEARIAYMSQKLIDNKKKIKWFLENSDLVKLIKKSLFELFTSHKEKEDTQLKQQSENAEVITNLWEEKNKNRIKIANKNPLMIKETQIKKLENEIIKILTVDPLLFDELVGKVITEYLSEEAILSFDDIVDLLKKQYKNQSKVDGKLAVLNICNLLDQKYTDKRPCLNFCFKSVVCIPLNKEVKVDWRMFGRWTELDEEQTWTNQGFSTLFCDKTMRQIKELFSQKVGDKEKKEILECFEALDRNLTENTTYLGVILKRYVDRFIYYRGESDLDKSFLDKVDKIYLADASLHIQGIHKNTDPTHHEEVVFKLLLSHFDRSPEIAISFNQMIWWYECDIILQRLDGKKYNIELDWYNGKSWKKVNERDMRLYDIYNIDVKRLRFTKLGEERFVALVEQIISNFVIS